MDEHFFFQIFLAIAALGAAGYIGRVTAPKPKQRTPIFITRRVPTPELVRTEAINKVATRIAVRYGRDRKLAGEVMGVKGYALKQFIEQELHEYAQSI